MRTHRVFGRCEIFGLRVTASGFEVVHVICADDEERLLLADESYWMDGERTPLPIVHITNCEDIKAVSGIPDYHKVIFGLDGYEGMFMTSDVQRERLRAFSTTLVQQS